MLAKKDDDKKGQEDGEGEVDPEIFRTGHVVDFSLRAEGLAWVRIWYGRWGVSGNWFSEAVKSRRLTVNS